MAKNKGKRLFNGCEAIIRERLGNDKAEVVMANAYKRYAELLEENKDEPKIMDSHTKARIYPGISIFEALVNEGCSRDEAAQVIYDFFDVAAAKGGKMLQKIMKIPGLYKKVPTLAPKLIDKSFGADAGFKGIKKKVDSDGMEIDMVVCPYNEICKKYNCPEIVKAYCHSDDVAYGNMHPKLEWARTKTLGRGGDCCDFIINVRK